METFIVIVTAQPGHEEDVTRIYHEQEALLKNAKGYLGRQVFRAEVGKMVKAVRRFYTPEELAKHPEPPHEHPGTQFVVIERWETVDHRMDFSKNAKAENTKELVQHLLPNHSHEFFEEV